MKVQVQVDMQLDLDATITMADAAIEEAALKVANALRGELGAGECQGYARIKGGVELRRVWSRLQDDWLETP